jgi:hypothetical protein
MSQQALLQRRGKTLGRVLADNRQTHASQLRRSLNKTQCGSHEERHHKDRMTIGHSHLERFVEYSRSMAIRWLLTLAMVLQTGCAAPVIDPIQEQLDERDGTTIVRLAQPVTLIADRPRGSGADPFAFIAPFEANQMGARQMQLWVAVPIESDTQATVAVWRDAVLVTELARTTTHAPYPVTATWQRQFVGDLSAAELDSLSAGSNLTVEVRLADGRSERFTSQEPAGPAMQEFRRRLGL